ncbi:hypothetical protein LJC06_02365 [Bacteroidales bacterium OttesenSCG-928-I14]|nr:hypothetical protein [Bacteroidales bacterium OttesenSCG-928-I14]
MIHHLASAQENRDFMKDMMKENMKMEIMMEFMKPEIKLDTISSSAPRVIKLNVNKKPLPVLGFNYKLNAFSIDYSLNYKDTIPLVPEYKISPSLFLPYSNIDEYDPYSTETITDIVANGVLTPLLAIPKLDIFLLANYLMKIGVLPDDPFNPTERKKAKALREIKEAYGVAE